MDKSFFFAVLAAVIWGFAPALEKVGLRGTSIDPFLGVFIRTRAQNRKSDGSAAP